MIGLYCFVLFCFISCVCTFLVLNMFFSLEEKYIGLQYTDKKTVYD